MLAMNGFSLIYTIIPIVDSDISLMYIGFVRRELCGNFNNCFTNAISEDIITNFESLAF